MNTTTHSPACPGCGKTLQKVTRSAGSMLNAEQFDAVRAGDWFCEACPGNGSARTGYRYFWDRDLSIPSPAIEQAPCDITEVDRLNAKIADLERTIEWLQGRIGITMGAAAGAGIAGGPVRVAGELPPSLLIRAYNSGYKSGHHDTVEAQYTDIDQRDMFTYHADVVADMIADGTLVAPAAPSEQAEKLMADMDTMRDEYASLSNALAFWLPTVPEQAGAIQDRIVHDVFFLGEYGEPKSAQDLGWITLNVGQSAPAAPLPAQQPATQAELDEFLAQYEWRTDEFCHTPTSDERTMLHDYTVMLGEEFGITSKESVETAAPGASAK